MIGWLKGTSCSLLIVARSADIRRGYTEAKLQENLDSEIMEVLLDEAREAFDAEIVVELTSNTSDEMEGNVERIDAWIKQWKMDNNNDS